MQGKASFSSERCWEDWMPPRKGLQRNPHLSSHAKVGSKWIKGLNIRSETEKRLEENGKSPSTLVSAIIFFFFFWI